MDGFFPHLGRATARYRWLIIGVWVVAFAAAIPGVLNVAGSLRSGGFEVASSESGRGAQILEQEFGRRTVTTGVLVFSSDDASIDTPPFRDAVATTIGRVGQIGGVKQIVSYANSGNTRLVSNDRRTTYALVGFVDDEELAKKLTPDVRDRLASQPPGIHARLMGFPALSYDLAKSSEHDLQKAELYSMPITLILLLLVFGTIVAAGLPLILGAVAVVISLAGIYLFSQKVETSIFAMNTASMIGLGLGIDFSLLMVSRFREELGKGISAEQATINTVATSGRSIVFSGLTVMLGLSVLCLYDLVLIRSIAMGMLLVAGVAMLGAVTLLPALFAVFGRQLNAYQIIPRKKKDSVGHADAGAWHRWSLVVMRRPWVFLVATVALLLALAASARELNAIGAGGVRGMPEDAESRQAFDQLLGAFGAGEATPIQVLIQTPTQQNGAWDSTTLGSLYGLVTALKADPRVQRVDSLVSLVPDSTSEAQFKSLTPDQLLGNPQAAPFVPAFVNINTAATPVNPPVAGVRCSTKCSDTQSVFVYARQDDLNQDTINLVKDLRSTIIPSITALRATDVYTTGQTALILDYRDKLFSQFPLLVGLVLLVTYVVLLLFFHSLILPLKAILMNVIAIVASYGVLVLVFQHGVGEGLLGFQHVDRLSMFSPVILFSILFGLSTDYEVFLLSRVKELYAHSHNNEHSVAMGLEHTAGIITAAGLIMIVVFGSFALGSTLVIKELGVGLAVAVLLDSTIIRVMMVPASMKLMDAANWWMPKFLDWIPQIRESVDLEEPGAARTPTFRRCPSCRRLMPFSARYCGLCGTELAAAAGAPPATRMQVAAQRADSGVRRVPVMLSDGHQQQQAWLVLRECYVEDDPGRDGIPQLQIHGLDVTPLSDSRPEIEIRHARVRM